LEDVAFDEDLGAGLDVEVVAVLWLVIDLVSNILRTRWATHPPLVSKKLLTA
jgi:hypothetical protein